MILQSKDIFQKAERVSGPQNMMKRGIMGRKRLLTRRCPRHTNECLALICVNTNVVAMLVDCFDHFIDDNVLDG